MSGFESRKSSHWRDDLTANGVRGRSVLHALYGWFFSPGFKTVLLYRLAVFFQARAGARAVSKIFWRWGVSVGGCYLAPTSQIGAGLSLPHAAGIVVGEGSVIGTGVKLYQHVTLGVKSAAQQTYPTLGDGVTVYSGAVLLGGIAIGDGAVIAANAVVLQDVPANCVAVGSPARIMQK